MSQVGARAAKENPVLKALSKFSKDFMSVLGIIFLGAILSLTTEKFLQWDNLKLILLQSSTVAICALGQAIILLTGNFDLSLGRNVAFTSCLGALLMKGMLYDGMAPMNPTLVILIILAAGTFIGVCNGLLTAYVGLPAFIATLGLQNVCYGLAKVITNATPIATFPNSIAWLGRGFAFPEILKKNLPWCVVLMLGIYIFAQFIFTKTKLGRNIYAVGGNKEAAFFAGINVKRYTFLAFVMAGFLAAFSGVVLMSRLNSVAITNGQSYEFDAVIGSIIGGISLTGGKGRLIGTMFGIIFVMLLFNGMTQWKVDAFMQDVLKGIVLVIAVTLDVLRNRKRV
ncbi:MAG: ABC transporter permease [Clostridiales bacterium]|jgi:ribose/xylose/arabinose/galactoside ABC-type transport system permease subunit|nr:ABC transporter permease [Clostridiales bacterium]OPZ69152.1 MAG: Ribose transport system permease protein RbsC [Firmicutes bacterium ADurb.Bin467]